MPSRSDPEKAFERLRKQAEELLRYRSDMALDEPMDLLELIHELKVHQMELEIQNEELKAAQQELSALHQEYEDLYEFAPCAYLTLTPQGIISRINLTGARLLGRARSLAIHRGMSTFLAKESVDDYFKALRQAERSGCLQSVELALKRQQEQPLWVQADIEAYCDEAGALLQWRMSLVDISESKRAEARREITLRLLRHLSRPHSLQAFLSEVTDLIREWAGCDAVGIRLRRDGDFPYVETRGFPEEFVEAESSLCEKDAQGRPVMDSHGNPVLECMCGSVIRGRFNPRLPFFTQRGSFWTSSTSELLTGSTEKDRQGKTRNRCHGEGYESMALIPLRYGNESLGLIQLNDCRRDRFNEASIDFFERLADSLALGLIHHRTSEALQESEDKYRSVVSQMSEGILLVNPETYIIMEANGAMEAMLGYAEAELAGKALFDIIPHEPSDIRDTTQKALSGEGLPPFERSYQRKDGQTVHVEVSISPIWSGRHTFLLGVVRDITERKRIEKIKEEVDSIIQHDLKSPLAGVIVLMRNMLEDNNLTSRQKEHLQLMFASEQRMLEMVKQSSALSQIEQGVYVGSTEEPCDVWKLIQEAVALHQPLAAEKGVELDLTAHGFERAEPEGVMVQGEEQLAYFVLSNVVRNAIEASPEHRAVTIRLEQKQGIDLRVHNEGAVPEGIRDRFFDKYVTCSRNKGTGLGTYSAKRMAEAQGWGISMRTSHEEGTTIILDIPKGA